MKSVWNDGLMNLCQKGIWWYSRTSCPHVHKYFKKCILFNSFWLLGWHDLDFSDLLHGKTQHLLWWQSSIRTSWFVLMWSLTAAQPRPLSESIGISYFFSLPLLDFASNKPLQGKTNSLFMPIMLFSGIWRSVYCPLVVSCACSSVGNESCGRR